MAASLLVLTSCTSGPLTHVRPTPPAERSVVTRFAALRLRHPVSWTAYLAPGGGDLPDGDAAYLTNAPIDPRCRVMPAATVARVVCARGATPVHRLEHGQVLVEVAMYYQDFERRTRDDLEVDGYRARLGSGADSAAACELRGSHRAVEVTMTPWTATVQPSIVSLYACFGAHSSRTRREFRTMLTTAGIDSRPDESVPVPTAAPCTHADLRVRQTRGESVSSAEFLADFVVSDVGRHTCALSGFPDVGFRAADGHRLGFGTRHGGARAKHLYLRPGEAAVFQLIVGSCAYTAHTQARTVRIRLPHVRGGFRLTVSHGGIPYCGTRAYRDTIGVMSLDGH